MSAQQGKRGFQSITPEMIAAKLALMGEISAIVRATDEQGVSHTWYARKAGITRADISWIVNGKRPENFSMEKLTRILNKLRDEEDPTVAQHSNEYTLKAHIVMCATGFTTKPGDKLVIVGDVCLGPPDSHTLAPITRVTKHNAAQPPTKPKTRGRPKTKLDPLSTPKSTRRTTAPTEDELVRLLATHGTLTSMRIHDILNINRKDTRTRSLTAHRMSKLINQGIVRRTKDPRGSNMLTTYSLVSKEHSNAAA